MWSEAACVPLVVAFDNVVFVVSNWDEHGRKMSLKM